MIPLAHALMLAAASFIVGALSLAAWYDWQTGRIYAARAQRAYERVRADDVQVVQAARKSAGDAGATEKERDDARH